MISVELIKSQPPQSLSTTSPNHIERIASYSGDSGIEDNTESESGTIHKQPITALKSDITSPATNQNFPQQQNGIRRRGSIWNIFGRKSNKKDQNSKNLTLGIKAAKQHKDPLDRSKSLPPPLSSSHSTFAAPPYFNHKGSSSRTSDLGDSIPSTPVSTISSGAGFPEIPGILGLHNLGNTCYFNTIIQCLAHIEIISEYFAQEHFMKDLAVSNSSFGQRIRPKNKLQASSSCLVSLNNNNNNNNNNDNDNNNNNNNNYKNKYSEKGQLT